MDFQYDYQGATHPLSLTQIDDQHFKATIGDREIEFSATQSSDDAWLLTIGHQRILAYIATKGEMRYVYVDGNTVTLTAVTERTTRRKSSAHAGDLTAQMPGQVIEVLVNEGDTVNRGQTLVILEAMKMEIRVTAPTDGVIQHIAIVQGDVVVRGQRLIELQV